MNTAFGRACKIARRNACLSQEQASELLAISSRSLAYYEGGRQVPDEIVAKMCIIYNAPVLGYVYLSIMSEVGRMILPKMTPAGISSSALTLRVNMKKAADMQTRLDEVCCDDLVDKSEEAAFSECLAALDYLIASALSVKFSSFNDTNKKARADCNRCGPKELENI